ncbi:hypothetical protein TanjilG_00851 [Lupinus angustifolius]|uniref:Association with the SNF1 complex (ASC) domain-containing protein n=1 Tax=Lupinus angustifolius TaxID=3871 RepID=A0A4P1R8B7_LUPAN|nr:PREDICTED: SNF1-related protein kinase regulatory subunit beta-2-like [Lupinus angustifolius]XP_019456067.1 PREDICTED: SNF1-related protein kinase regulatory subunit beta-2-like [Lupinus angustifolius]XP_019456068.1 PREDICTED: SNF1-related protein kinase regulatory subunit beta-2-like [Lupinus angustifolius]XP_019456069.1 PREDICTED: SNF1-related protein kinase regulatory subunit beta-2-like [Lupinus angustifolius]OIW04291.1 hypothetical protein TanjilG_00851 [Lupinus angustifolius]
MRNKSGDGTSGVNKDDDDENYEEQEMQFLQSDVNNTNGFIDPLVHLHLHSHGACQPPPPLVIQQAHALMQNGMVEFVVHERLKSVRMTWNYPATSVAIAGSWDNWESMEALQNAGGESSFVIVKTLPIGIYHYRFIVDGYWTHAPHFPSAYVISCHAYNNILDLQVYVQETLGRLSDLEDPPSPPSSYNNIFLDEGELSKPPPDLPPQLPLTIREDPSTASNNPFSHRPPTHVELNHLYIHKTYTDQCVALQSSYRFQNNYVTMVLRREL